MGDDGGVVGNLGDAEHGACDAELIHPMGGAHPALGNHEFVGQEPQSGGLGHDEHDHCNANVDDEGAGKDHSQPLMVASPKLEGQEA